MLTLEPKTKLFKVTIVAVDGGKSLKTSHKSYFDFVPYSKFLPAMHMNIPFHSSVTPNAISSIDQVWSAIARYI